MITAAALTSDACSPAQIPLPFPKTTPLLPVPIEHGDVGELRHRCSRFAQTLAEAICGVRPTRQLGPWLTREVHDQLTRYVRQRYGAGTPRRQPRVVSVHVSAVGDHAAEVAARMVLAGRSHAIAIRLQRVPECRGRSRWLCTAAQWA